MRGFQLWINLPAAEKMRAPAYRDVPASEIPTVEPEPGVRMKVIAGALRLDGKTIQGPIRGSSTEPLYLDIALARGQVFRHPIAPTQNAFVYCYEGELEIGPEQAARTLLTRTAGVLSPGTACEIRAGAEGARLILLAARPIGESVVQYGPFVMNTQEEIRRAIADYESGRFGEPAKAQ